MALAPTTTIPEISALLREMGEGELADRLDYLASDEDLDPGESPATAESARGFFEFFTSVESEGVVGLVCSPDGWLCAVWRFPDERSGHLWFLDDEGAMFAATGRDGKFIATEWNGKIAKHSEIRSILTPEELFI